MAGAPLQNALEALVRPLAFAARDDFAGLARVRDLETTVEGTCRELLRGALPADVRAALERVAELFAEPLDAEARVDAVRRTLALLEPCSEPGWGDAVLSRSPDVLPGVGPKRAEAFARRGLASVGDLLFFLPSRYEDRRALVEIGDLEVGRRSTFIAEVRSVGASTHRGRRRFQRVLEAEVGDATGSVRLKWFRVPPALESLLDKGVRLLVTGDVKRYRFSKEIVHPEVEPVDDAVADTDADATEGTTTAELDALRRIIPDYLTPEGVPPRTLRRLVASAVAEYADLVEGHLPERIVRERKLPSPGAALRAIHCPEPDADVDEYRSFASVAHERLVLEELYLLQLGLLLRRTAGARLPAIPIRGPDSQSEALAGSLPFELTGAQLRVWEEIRSDLARPHPMNRLVQGDVGSGKTAVALLAAAWAAREGLQTALMAPTELLAEQHCRTLRELVEASDSLGLRVGLLTASLPRSESRRTLAALESGEIDFVVGTHALVQKDVRFRRLALAIVDEQHRFGVVQRATLAEQEAGPERPHTLVMTATPIPRTLSLTLFGDLDVSVIDELPPGRSPVETLLLREGEGKRVVELVRETADRGEQIFVVYPLVEESEKVDLRSALESAGRIRAAFPDLAVDVVHGRLDAADRAEAMERFRRGETRILVSTTVIEVGVDVPAATLMVIEHAERFGVAQLHQLRGRVGRGNRPGTCVLVARGGGADGEARLQAMLATTDGFEIADADLRIRGPGDFLGTRQSGHLPDLRIADLLRDARFVGAARDAARQTLERDPNLEGQPLLLRAVEARWGDRLSLLEVG